jgi:hypothetical protein
MDKAELYEKIYGTFPSPYMEEKRREVFRQQGIAYGSTILDFIHDFFYYRLMDITHDTWSMFTVELLRIEHNDRRYRSKEMKLKEYRDKAFKTFGFA